MSLNENEALWLTTSNNPFDYFEDFENWWKFDRLCGYYTCERIANMTHNSSQNNLSEYEKALIQNDAVKELYDLTHKIRDYTIANPNVAKTIGLKVDSIPDYQIITDHSLITERI